MNRLIPDSECVQSKCALNTTGCWDECHLRRHPIAYASPVQGTTSQPTGSATNAVDWLTIARKHGYAFPSTRMQDFVAELLQSRTTSTDSQQGGAA